MVAMVDMVIMVMIVVLPSRLSLSEKFPISSGACVCVCVCVYMCVSALARREWHTPSLPLSLIFSLFLSFSFSLFLPASFSLPPPFPPLPSSSLVFSVRLACEEEGGLWGLGCEGDCWLFPLAFPQPPPPPGEAPLCAAPFAFPPCAWWGWEEGARECSKA